MAAVIGYARVSAAELPDALTEQLNGLGQARCSRIERETVQTVLSDRPVLWGILNGLQEGDALVVVSLHRLCASMLDFEKAFSAVRGSGAVLKVLNIGLDTSTKEARPVLQAFHIAAELERAVSRERQGAGIARAKAEGRFRGQAPTAARKAPEVVRLRAEGKSAREIASIVGISPASVFRILANPELANRIASGEASASWTARPTSEDE